MTRQPRPDLLAHAILRREHEFADPRTIALAVEVQRRDIVRSSRWRYRQQRRASA